MSVNKMCRALQTKSNLFHLRKYEIVSYVYYFHFTQSRIDTPYLLQLKVNIIAFTTGKHSLFVNRQQIL